MVMFNPLGAMIMMITADRPLVRFAAGG